jgi:hypothetical protein
MTIDRVWHECEEVRRICNQFQADHVDKGATCILHRAYQNLGTDLSKLKILPLGYALSDFVVFVEDDTVVSKDFLQWMEAGSLLCRSGNHNGLWSVTGYSRCSEATVNDLGGPYTAAVRNGFKPWTWGMWRDKYDILFGSHATEYLNTVDDVNGRFDWWAAGWRSDLGFKVNGPHPKFIYPILARTQCIGADRASHTPNAEWFYANEHNPYWAGDVSLVHEVAPVWTLVEVPSGVRTMDNE